MISEDEFSEQDVIDIISAALEAHEKSNGIPLGLGDIKTFERLSAILAKYMVSPDIQFILSELRSVLYEDLNYSNTQDLHRIISRCTRCSNTLSRPELPRWNLVDPDIVFVVENTNISDEISNTLIEALKAAGFTSGRCCLTYATRCNILKVNAENISNCTNYLLTELTALHPKLIVTFGATTLGSLLGVVPKLKDYVNDIFWMGHNAILPLSSIAYLIRQGGVATTREILTKDLETAYRFCYGK